MIDVEVKLRVKYGLAPSEPTDNQIRKFIIEMNKLIQMGDEPEVAGEKSAQISFSSYRSCAYRSQADTIYDLIQAIKTKARM